MNYAGQHIQSKMEASHSASPLLVGLNFVASLDSLPEQKQACPFPIGRNDVRIRQYPAQLLVHVSCCASNHHSTCSCLGKSLCHSRVFHPFCIPHHTPYRPAMNRPPCRAGSLISTHLRTSLMKGRRTYHFHGTSLLSIAPYIWNRRQRFLILHHPEDSFSTVLRSDFHLAKF